MSADFDTIDHNILITRLSSWFSIHGSVSVDSSLTYHLGPFVLNVITTFFSFHTSSCGVPQGSVLNEHLTFSDQITSLS